MLKVKPTKNLLGVTIQGDYEDFNQVVESIHRMTRSSDDNLYLYGVSSNLLGLCYDIRHAYQGDRDITFVDNNMNEDLQSYHEVKCDDTNVYFSVNVFFTEALFLAIAVPKLYPCFAENYEKTDDYFPTIPKSTFWLDQAVLNVLFTKILEALREVIGDEEMSKIITLIEKSRENYVYYVTHFINKCTQELYETKVERRKDKLRVITKRFIKKTAAYKQLEKILFEGAIQYDTTIYELTLNDLEYPEEVEW